ncbi:MAG: glycosyltransferase family 39 protein [Gammaproteobacteria bacterium]|nr:glycosyltransferase family 39 protein [Gammaproteobacteria bacterium]
MVFRSPSEQLLHRPLICLAFCVLVYLVLILPALPVHGLANDELIDLRVALAYLRDHWGWLVGSDRDASQARLSMYATALANFILGTESLKVSRLLSVFYGALAIGGAYLFCARHLTPLKGVLAALLLAISPYYLAFTKVGMTEGDALVALTGVLLALAVAELCRRPTVGTAGLTALAGGLAVSAKLPVAVLMPAAFIAFMILRHGRTRVRSAPSTWLLLAPLLFGLAVVVGGWWYPSPDSIYVVDRPYRNLSASYLMLHITWVAGAWTLAAVGAVLWRERPVGRLIATGLVAAGSVLTFFVLPPVHTTNPGIIQELARMAAAGEGLPEGLPYSALVFHLLVILIKSGPAMGLLLLGSCLAAPWLIRRRPVLLIPLLFTVFSVAMYALTGRAQTFYMIGVMPLLAILAADVLGEILRRSRYLFAGTLALVSLNAAADLARSWPDMHLNGYQYLGERYIAHRATLGYKGVAQTPSDGNYQVMQWALENVEPGKRVVTYLRERMVIHFMGPRSGIRFQVRHGFDPRVGIDEADYVLLHINATLRQFDSSPVPLIVEQSSDVRDLGGVHRDSIHVYPFDRDALHRDFEKVYAVERAFGIEVASVWRRKQ